MAVNKNNVRFSVTFPKEALVVLDQLVANSKSYRETRSTMLLNCLNYVILSNLKKEEKDNA